MQISTVMYKTQNPRQNLAPSNNTKRSENSSRIAKVIARAGLCSRREAESWIQSGRVKLNGQEITTPATLVTTKDKILVDGNLIPNIEPTRLWMFHKPRGVITSNKDPEGRPTVYSRLPSNLPRVVSVGRLDFNTEGLLLLTNDGGLARIFELPATGWLRQYRVRAYGRIQQEQLNSLKDGLSIGGMFYGSIVATLDRATKDNCWLTIGLREGKNREVKNVLEHLGLQVNRLIRISYGPYNLKELPVGQVIEIEQNEIINYLSESQIADAGLVFRFNSSDQPKSKRHSGPKTKKLSTSDKGRRKNRHIRSSNKPKLHSHQSKKFDKSSPFDGSTKRHSTNTRRNKQRPQNQRSAPKKAFNSGKSGK